MSSIKRDSATALDDVSPPAVFDLLALAYAPTAEMEVINPINGDPTGWVITFAGPGHPKTVAQNDDSARKAIADRRRAKEAQVNGRKYKADEETPEGNRQDNARSYAQRILSWHPAVNLLADEPPLEFSEANAARILADPNFFWLYRDVALFLAADVGFIKSSEKS